MEQMAKYYCWGMSLSARTAAAGAAAVATTTTATNSLVRSWPPPAHGHGGEPSWEELAFARDAAGHLGGCVWPPRSYTCTFCRREFRSAQALGGHMNVHRRDRARLRQCASPDLDDEAPPQPPHKQSSIAPPADPQLLHPVLISAAGPISAAACVHQQHISTTTIIKESKNKVVISIPAAAATAGMMSKEAIDYEEEADEEIVAERRKRRRVHHDLFFLRPPLATSKGVEEHDAIKVPNKVIITNPSPNSLRLAGRQEVDLELRLGSI